jgi:hypothetical protein
MRLRPLQRSIFEQEDKRMKKPYLILAATVLILLVFVGVSRPQSRTLYFSNQYRADAASMPQTESFSVDDPIYVVLNLSRGQNTIGDLVSTDPKTGKRNFWFCFSPGAAEQNFKGVIPKCVGILPEPLSDEVLNGKAYAYLIRPSGPDLARNKTDLSEGVVSLMSADRNDNHPVEVPFTYYIYGKADRALNAGDVVISCQGWDQSATGRYVKDAETKSNNEWDAETKKIITAYVSGHRSQRADPQLEKAIRAWWRGAPTTVVINPMLRVDFVKTDYEYTRNEFGIVLRKSIDAFYVFKLKKDGKCYVSSRSFGYESLGGGAFGAELKAWLPNSVIRLANSREIERDNEYEIDCAVVGG